ncbi:BESS motif domain-containing protein [Phthorimaea operculella]|nr:BESS motif domain-containing protein [Phthorimaea operculella]
MRAVQWGSLGNSLNVLFIVTVEDCRHRWRNIRTRYSKCFKQRVTANDVSTVRDYYLGPHLRFLDKFIKPRPRKTITYPKESTTDDTTEATEDYNDNSGNEESDQSFDKNPEVPIVDSFDKPSEIVSLVDPATLFISKQEEEEDARTFDDDVTKNPLQEYYTTETRNNFDIESIETEDSSYSDIYFLKSLLPDMAEMNPAQKRRFKRSVMNLVGEVLDGHETPMKSSQRMKYTRRKKIKKC